MTAKTRAQITSEITTLLTPSGGADRVTAAELRTVVQDIIDSAVLPEDGGAAATFDIQSTSQRSPGSALAPLSALLPAYSPREWSPLCKPYSSQPTLAVADATTEALWRACQTGVPLVFEQGTYWFSGTFASSGRDGNPKRQTFYFNNTTFRIHSSATLTRANGVNGWTSFAEVTSQQGDGVPNLPDARGAPNVKLPGASTAVPYAHNSIGTQGGDNLPARANTWVFWDISYSERSMYYGNVSLDGGPNLDNLAAWGCSNEFLTDGDGGGGSKYAGEIIITGGWHIGIWGNPKYQDARNRYPGGFVGCQIMRVRIERSVDIWIICGGNIFDDVNIGELNVIGSGGIGGGTTRANSGPGYMFGTLLKMETCYTNTFNNQAILDAQQMVMKFGNWYLEDAPGQSGTNGAHPACAIISRNGNLTVGSFKSGASSYPNKGAMIYDVSDDSDGVIIADKRTGETAVQVGGVYISPPAMVKLQSRNGSRRNYQVTIPYPETQTPGSTPSSSAPRGLPYVMERNPLSAGTPQVSANDMLTSFAPVAANGASAGLDSHATRWLQTGQEGATGTMAGTGGLKRRVPTYTP